MGKHEHRPQLRPAREGQRGVRWVLIGLALALGMTALIAIPAVALTERPQFCTGCHEMQPYYDAYSTGAHHGVSCVECHVDSGIPARVGHKFVALQEVYRHFTSSPKFPQGKEVVPDSRCVQCHKDLGTTVSGFDHKIHVGQLKCEQCHKQAGHNVTPQALAEAGVISRAAKLQMASSTTVVASAAATGAYSPDADRIINHKSNRCVGCHRLGDFKCTNCHTAPHAPRGECVTCHRADPKPKAWAFAHPTSTTCNDCHTSKHADRGACVKCHAPGGAWTFTHPDAKAACVQCHDKPTGAKHAFRTKCAACHSPSVPFARTARTHKRNDICLKCHDMPRAKHSTLTCRTCHAAGVSWAFVHPARTDCGTCHREPRVHFGATCSGCHKAGKPWKSATVNHKLVGTRCSSCHTAPASHTGRGTACASCHKQAGKSWAFSHSAGLNCGLCHQAPASHQGRGTACASCHKSTSSFKGASFNHPAVGMNISSMSCTDCHPNGYTTHTCTKCHDGSPGN